MKKVLISVFILIFTGITCLQYSENLKLRREPPSDKWAKEVLLSSGNIIDYPQVIKYNDRYIVVYTDGTKINILAIDNLGKKLNEKSFPAEGDMAMNIHAVTDSKDINLSWTVNGKEFKSMYSLILDNEFNIKDKTIIDNVEDLKQAGNSLLIIGYKDKINLIDFKAKKSSDIEAPSNSLICSTKSGERYVVAFLNRDNNFCYSLVQDGAASEPKEVGVLKGTTRVSYYNAAISIDGDKGYIFAEYTYQGMFGGSKVMEFALDGSSYKVRETADKERVISVFNTVSFTAADENKKGVKFMAGGFRPLGKKESYDDVLELEVNDGIIANSIPMSRTRALSGFPSGYEDTVVFCDVVNYDYSNLYMTSYREDFKAANNTIRGNEYVLAFLDTIQGILFTFVYLVVFGALWIIPSFCSVSLISLLEYKFNEEKRKVIFIISYLISVIFKIFFIYTIIFKRFRYFLPDYLTPLIGIGTAVAISIVCCTYCYRKYIWDLQKNTIASNFSSMFILDSWFTLFLFIPFIK
jgi:hypothetical protein